MEEKVLTVGQLRAALDGVPDELEVKLSSDTGVDQGDGEIVIEDAYRTKYDLPNGRKFKDGSTGVDYFTIYANDRGGSSGSGWDGEIYGEDC